jgi:hypothetical protein
MTKRYVTTVAMPRKETLLLRSYLSLMHGKTDAEWEYAESGPADVSIVGADSDDGERYLMQAPGLCIVYNPRNEPAPAAGRITIGVPIRMAALVQALNLANAALRGGRAAAPEVAGSGTLAELLRGLLASGAGHCFVGRDGVIVSADLLRRTYRCSAPLDAAQCGLRDWSVRQRGAAGLEPSAEDRPLTRLLWIAGMSELQIDPGVYRLTRWPDLGSLPHRPSFVRLAAMFLRQPSSAEAAAGSAGVPTREVAAFLNASVLAGYALRVEGVAVAPVAAAEARFGGLVSRIRRRLGL